MAGISERESARGSALLSVERLSALYAALAQPRARLLLIILILAALLRLPTLGTKDLWFDEAWSVWFSDRSHAFLWNETPKFETHPPLYYVFLKVWREFMGSSPFMLRLPSALASLLTVIAVYAAGRAVDRSSRGVALGLMAALLAAVWRFQIDFAQEARAYAFLSLGNAIMLAGALRIVANPMHAQIAWPRLLLFDPATALGFVAMALGMAMQLWAHNLGTVPVFVAGSFLTLWWLSVCKSNRGVFFNLAFTGMIVILLYAPNIPIILMQIQRVSSGFWLEAPSFDGLIHLTSKVVSQPLTERSKITALVVAPMILGGIAGLWRLSRATPAVPILVTALIAGPWLLLTAVTYLFQPVLMPKTLIMLQPPLFLAYAALPWLFPSKLRPPIVGSIIALAVIGLIPESLNMKFERPYSFALRSISASEMATAPVLVTLPNLIPSIEYHSSHNNISVHIVPVPPSKHFPYVSADGRSGSAPQKRVNSRYIIADDDVEQAMTHLRDQRGFWLFHRSIDVNDPSGKLRAAFKAASYCETEIVSPIGNDVALSRFDRAMSCP